MRNGTLRERQNFCGTGARSDNAFHNAFHWELMVRACRSRLLQHAKKNLCWSSTEESSPFFFISSSITSNCRITSFGFHPLRNHGTLRPGQITYFFNWDFQEKHKAMFRLPQNGRSRCTELSNFSGEKISLSSTAAKTRRSVCFQGSFELITQI